MLWDIANIHRRNFSLNTYTILKKKAAKQLSKVLAKQIEKEEQITTNINWNKKIIKMSNW